MRSTPPSSALTRRTFLAALAFLPHVTTPQQQALNHSLTGIPATAILLNQATGQTLAAYGQNTISNTPGSILKPLLLANALEQHLVTPATTVFCRRSLTIDNRPYPCTHPQSNIAFTAEEAITYSCNTWFADLANRFTPSQIATALRAYHLLPIQPATPAQKQLLTLGLAGITTTPAQIAAAYRILAAKLSQQPTVANGLRNSVTYGMAHNASIPNCDIYGKTGTATAPSQPWSHGWFSGLTTLHAATLVLTLYLPQGNGADAAHLAQTIFTALIAAGRP